MNLKDRLIIAKQPDVKNIKETAFEDVSLIFKNSKKQTKLIRDYILNNKNIVFLADRTFDRNLLVRYIQLLLPEKQINLLEKPESRNLSVNSKINMIKDPDIIDFVRILQAVILGYKPFVSCISLNYSEDILDTFKALISANYENLTDKHIETLFKESDTVFVNITNQNDDWTISSVNEFSLNEKITVKKAPKETKSNNKIKNILDNEEINSAEEEKVINNSEEDIIQATVVVDKTPEKVNKYKLLKEKVRAKKNS